MKVHNLSTNNIEPSLKIKSNKDFVILSIILIYLGYRFIFYQSSSYVFAYLFSILLIILLIFNYFVEIMNLKEKNYELIKMLNVIGRILLPIIIVAYAYYFYILEEV